MFTSRSEFRLLLRAENADIRLSQRAIDLGLLSDRQKDAFYTKKQLLKEAHDNLEVFYLPQYRWAEHGIKISKTKTDRVTARRLLSFPNIDIEGVLAVMDTVSGTKKTHVDSRVQDNVHIECQYSHYLQ